MTVFALHGVMKDFRRCPSFMESFTKRRAWSPCRAPCTMLLILPGTYCPAGSGPSETQVWTEQVGAVSTGCPGLEHLTEFTKYPISSRDLIPKHLAQLYLEFPQPSKHRQASRQQVHVQLPQFPSQMLCSWHFPTSLTSGIGMGRPQVEGNGTLGCHALWTGSWDLSPLSLSQPATLAPAGSPSEPPVLDTWTGKASLLSPHTTAARRPQPSWESD